jgi:hypothetical protein
LNVLNAKVSDRTVRPPNDSRARYNKPNPKPELTAPVSAVRFQVVTKGENAYHVIERSTGKVKGFRFTWGAAINLAQALEARADGVKVNIDG